MLGPSLHQARPLKFLGRNRSHSVVSDGRTRNNRIVGEQVILHGALAKAQMVNNIVFVERYKRGLAGGFWTGGELGSRLRRATSASDKSDEVERVLEGLWKIDEPLLDIGRRRESVAESTVERFGNGDDIHGWLSQAQIAFPGPHVLENRATQRQHRLTTGLRDHSMAIMTMIHGS
ncbi:hypothetical protein VTN00DRAFT_78 [Thermoascus crustaceus]|uniref:uncharacterized protein n=1 Tax=Thermoascus crustaceus TaxID=5088 RepID=UPI00374453CC